MPRNGLPSQTWLNIAELSETSRGARGIHFPTGMDFLMKYLFDLAYLLLLVVASPWLIWQSLRTGKYREGYGEKLLGLVPRRGSQKKCLWFHAVSVGEV